MAGVWLGRVPIAETAARSFCRDRDLDCEIDISRLDFGGATLRNLRITGVSGEPAVSADRLAVDLDWTSPFAATAGWIGGENVVLRLNLTGDGPVLGDLDDTIQALAKGRTSGGGGKMPRLDLRSVRLVADTAMGPVEATGWLRASAPDAFDMSLNAPPARLSSAAGSIDFAGGELVARSRGGDITGRLFADLGRLETGDMRADDVRVDLSLAQANGTLTGKGAASAAELGRGGSRLLGAQASADLEAAAIDLTAVTTQTLLASIRRLTVDGAVREGAAPGARFEDATLSARLAPADSGGASGDVRLTAESLIAEMGEAERLEVEGRVDLPGQGPGALGKAMRAAGTAKLSGAALDRESSDSVSEAVSSPLGVLPAFAAAASRAARRAGEKFELILPWSFQIDGEGFDASALDGTSIHAASGLKGVVLATAEPTVFAYSARGEHAWRAAGEVSLSGGGAPPMTVQITTASGGGSAPQSFRLAGAGRANIGPWTVGSQALTATLRDMEVDAKAGAGKAAARLDASVTGEFAGIDWTDAKANTQLNATWSDAGLVIASADGVSLKWKAAAVDKTRFGAGSVTYSPAGPLARTSEDAGLHGDGVLTRLAVPVQGDGFTARLAAGPTRIGWMSDGATVVDFRADKVTAELLQGEALTPATFPEITGRLRLKDGWSLEAAIRDAEVRAEAVAARGLNANITLSGAEGRPMEGSVRDLAMSLSDPAPKRADWLFEPVSFRGAAALADGQADFSGDFMLVTTGVQLGTVAGRHELESADGSLTFSGAPLIFNPGSLEPSALSPLLRGPANVTGRVDLSGAASWSSEDFKASAAANLQNIGFALASAGVFEGVSGKVEVSDLLQGVSPPGQALTIDRVTLGIPFEDGRLSFALLGYDAVRLESASWPFAGGRLNIRPVDYALNGQETRFVGEAVDWDLSSLVERFKIPDLQAQGTVSGEFPIVFSTGSARIDHAVLEASEEGGVIRYVGSTGDAAASADANAKMLFDALKDFRYRVMRIGLDGDLADRMVLTFDLLGSNPDVFYGSQFDIGISIDSPLLNLLNIVNQGQDEVNAIVERVTTGAAREPVQ